MKNGCYYFEQFGIVLWEKHYKDDLLHREDGPAHIEFDDGFYSHDKPIYWYYLEGKNYTKEEWEKEILVRKLAGVK